MDTARVAPWVGVAASVATLAGVAVPYALISEPGTGLGLYYAAGPFGAWGFAFLALVAIVGFLAGERGNASPEVAAGVALVVGLAMLGLAVSWAASVPSEVVLSFPAAWMGSHRWVVLAVVGLVPVSAAAYARAVVGV